MCVEILYIRGNQSKDLYRFQAIGSFGCIIGDCILFIVLQFDTFELLLVKADRYIKLLITLDN